jgi:hypothetical protein
MRGQEEIAFAPGAPDCTVTVSGCDAPHSECRPSKAGVPPRSRRLLVAASRADLPEVTADTVLAGADATREAVLAAVRNATHVHFGCHASSNPAEPSGSMLHLPSGQELPVLEICRIQPRSARLAFLAACGTSRTSQRLADESIHLSSAFLLSLEADGRPSRTSQPRTRTNMR